MEKFLAGPRLLKIEALQTALPRSVWLREWIKQALTSRRALMKPNGGVSQLGLVCLAS